MLNVQVDTACVSICLSTQHLKNQWRLNSVSLLGFVCGAPESASFVSADSNSAWLCLHQSDSVYQFPGAVSLFHAHHNVGRSSAAERAWSEMLVFVRHSTQAVNVPAHKYGI